MAKRLTQIVNRDLHNDVDEPDHVYVDFSIVNNQADGSSVPLQFNDLRSTSILENPCDYYATIARFDIDTVGSIPILLPLVQVGQSDPNLSVYSFTLVYKTYVYQQFLQYVPENPSIPTPNAPLTKQDMTTKYYFVSSFMYFIGLLNNTLKSAFNGLKNVASDLPSATQPFILYDSTTGQMVFNCESAYDVKANQDPIYVYANPQMYNLLSGFEWLNQGAQPNGKNYKLNVYSIFNTNVYVQPDDTQYIQSYEEYNSIINWCPIQCISITTTSLPISQTIISDPVQFNSITNMNSSSSNISSPILTDFTVALTTGKEYLGSINYVSPAQYRLIDLFGHGSIKQINLNVIWKDIYSNTYQFELASGSSANLKLLFRSKAFNKSNNI